MNKQDYQRLVLGAIIGASSLILLFYMKNTTQPAEAQQYKSNFEVIDNYKGCDVVRYSPPNGANYHYFLDCQK
jgi:hypothetical protein